MKKLLILLLTTFSAGFVYAQAGQLSTDTASAAFINNAWVGGMTEIAASKLAMKKADNPEVKSFAAAMLKDHAKANGELKKIARSKGYQELPQAIKKPDETLTKTDGSEFDEHYVTMMLQGHQQSVVLYQNAVKNVQDSDVKAFAERTLPVLNRHLATIQKLASGMNITTASQE